MIDKMFTFDSQQSFIEKLNAYRTNQMTRKASERKMLGKVLTQDGVSYLIAILSKIISDNSGYMERR